MNTSSSSQPTSATATIVRALHEQVAKGNLDVPLLPEAVSAILQLPEDAGAPEVCEHLRRDPALSAHILRLSNTPLFRGRAPIVSLPQAVSRLGFAQVRQLAVVAASEGRVFRSKHYREPVLLAFRNSVAAAFFASSIARIRRADVEYAFLGGLLHNIGRPVLWRTVEAIAPQFGVTPAPWLVAPVVDALHTRAGACLARAWELPIAIVELFDVDGAAPPSDLPEEANIVSLAVLFAKYFSSEDVADSTTWLASIESAPVAMELGLSAAELERIWAVHETVAVMIHSSSVGGAA